MKKSLRLIFIFALSISYSQEVVHINFDDINPDATFSSWNNSSTFAFQPNPIQDPVNASPNVGQFIAGDDPGTGIGLSNPSSVFPNPFDFAQSSLFKIKFLAGEPVTITLKIENQPDWGPHNSETSATYDATQIGTWQELTFDFAGYSDIFINSIVIKVDGPNWEEGDTLYFDDIVGPPLYATPAFEFTPVDGSTDISVGGNMVIETNNKFYDPGAVTITDFSNKVAVRLGDENGTDIGFEASIQSDSKITITPDLDLSYSTTYWFGIIENSMYHSNGTQNIGTGASFTTKASVVGDVNEMLFDFDTVNQNIDFVSWAGTGFSKISNPYPSGINTSANVGKYIHAGNNSGLENALVNGATPLDPPDFSETPFVKVKVWIDKPVDVIVRIQNYPDYGQGFEQTISVTETNQWVQLTYNFSSVTASNYDRAQIYFDRWQSGGSLAGDLYYFDDYELSNIAPAAEVTFNPADGATDVLQYAQLSINSNFQFVNLDGSDIDDASSKLELRENDSSGTPVPFAALISEDNNTFTIVPNELLTAGASYWYGVKDGVVKYDETQQTISGLNATFTASNAGLPNMVVYNDFDGNDNLSLVTQALGDPAGLFSPQAMDPIGGSNSVMEWNKGESWGGWERIHLQLEMPFDISQGDVFSFRVFSSVKTGIRFKLADAMNDWDQTGNYESGSEIFPDQNILNTNQWKTYYFNVSEMPEDSNFDHLFIFLGRGDNEPGADEVFYIDDIMGPALQSSASLNDFDNGQVVLYPNPAQNVIYIKNLLGNKTIRIFDINGRLVHQTKTASNTLSIAALNQGFYFLEINGQTKKFIKK